ncbi:MAG: response regulator, partial [bacterium]|nr:response regulator [bacterium]
RITFESEHYQVFEAEDGIKALELMHSHKPDIVILDVTMPNMSGWEVVERVRSDPQLCLTPIVLLTSLTGTKNKIIGLKLGADEYIPKPFNPYELLTRVENLIRRTKENLAANPLTGLPGNISLERDIKKRMSERQDFTLLYIDCNNFKAFNDKYGFERGDNIIKLLASILRSAVVEAGNSTDFIGHIGGDDFIVITSADPFDMAGRIKSMFDTVILMQYDEEARKNGYIVVKDRDGIEKKFPIMGVGIGGVRYKPDKYIHYSQIVEAAKDALKASKLEGKFVLIE